MGHSWGLLEGSCEGLGPSWGVLGGSWEPRGAILRPLGGVSGPLGAASGPLEAVSWDYVATMRFQKKMGVNLVPILKPKRHPKSVPNGAQNDQKSNAKIHIKKEGFEDPLGSVLGQSWVVLGSILGSKIEKFQMCFKVLFLKKVNAFE